MHVYKFHENSVSKEPVQVWNKEGKVSFNKELTPCFLFSKGKHVDKHQYPCLRGLDWQQVYCLTHLTTYFARYDHKKDTYKWKRMKDEPFEDKIITVPGKVVRAWQEIYQG